MNSKPNLFKLATSELSQDGFITWLILWANESLRACCAELCDCAQAFVRFLISKQSKQLPSYEKPITKIEAGRKGELKNIDIWAKINDEVLIIIEDKTFTGEHSNQLERYKEAAKEYCDKHGYKDEHGYKLACIYLKTASEAKSSLKVIEDKGFSVVGRKELLDMFLPYKDKIGSDIFGDFVEHLQEMEVSEERFGTTLIKDWDGHDWCGFYRYLETQTDVGGWSFVNNPADGFMGLWWHFRNWKDKGVVVYLQIEAGDLCFKIGEVRENHGEIRTEWHNILMSKAKEESRAEIVKPQRFGSGSSMTVAVVDRKDWLGPDDAVVDKDAVVGKLKEYERFLDRCLS